MKETPTPSLASGRRQWPRSADAPRPSLAVPFIRFIRFCLAVFLLVLAAAVQALSADPDRPEQRLSAFLDSLQVERHWLAGTHVDWRTGEADRGPKSGAGQKSHCSAFVAAAGERLGIYILRPPEHGQVLLANAQSDWLSGPGRESGWRPVRDAREAQERATAGDLVVASYKSPNPHKAGHIAIVRPGHKSTALLQAEGPDIIQAGQVNYASTSLKNGFRQHRGAWRSGEIRFYAHGNPGARRE